MADEEDVAMELEALQAMCGDDCFVIDPYPPLLHLHIKPRTADISSQQFVEAAISIHTGPKYPNEPPIISLVESKGLDEQRQKHLISCIQHKVSGLMLVEICEKAVERLTVMNHPDGDCPLCLYPLVPEDSHSKTMPFMKLMSCFHCFHSECMIRWWNWLHNKKETKALNPSTESVSLWMEMENHQGLSGMGGEAGESLGNCPICRKVFHAKHLEHVLHLVDAHSLLPDSDGSESNDDEKLVQSDSENIRRERFEAILKLQHKKGGLIEPKKNIAVVPGIFLPQPGTSTSDQ